MSDLSNYFRAQAEWRDEKAAQYPSDERNPQSAAALRYLADSIDADVKGEVGEVETLEPHLVNGKLGGKETLREVKSYGYGYPVNEDSNRELLKGLVALCFEDAYTAVGETGEDANGLFGFEVDAAREGVVLGPHYWRLRGGSGERELEGWVNEARAAQLEPGEGGELPDVGTPGRKGGA